jgi:tetratricopeptide (TPR) repeat protein
MLAVEQLDSSKGKSPLGFFYLGVSLYKQTLYEQAIKAFQKSNELDPSNAQLQYNLGLAYFKEEQYTLAIEHLKMCT